MGACIACLMSVFLPTIVWANSEVSPRVWRVYFEGNDTFSDIIVQEVVANESVRFFRRAQFWRRNGDIYSEAEVRRDVIRLERFYQRRGFPDVHITFSVDEGKKEWRRKITFRIYEGRPIRVESLEYSFVEETEEIKSSREFERIVSRNPFRERQRFTFIRKPDVEGDLTNMLKDKGYAFAKVDVESQVDSVAYTAQVRINLNPGAVAYFGDINIDGHETVSEELIRKETGLSSGDRFSQKALTRAQQEVFSHHLFRFVTLSLPEQPRDSLVDLNIRVREHPLRTIQIQAGVGTEDIIRGGVTWQHRNPFGNAHSFSVSGRASFIDQRVSMDYLIPYVFNTYSSYIFSPFAQRLNEPNYLLLSIGATNSFVYQYSQELAGTISYEYTANEEVLKDLSVVLRDSTQSYNQSVIRFSGYYNESTLERGEGWAVRPFFEISGFFNTGTLNYRRASLDVRRFLDFSRNTQLGLRANTGILFTEDLAQMPSSILYYIGGNSTVRGWSRNDLGPKRASFDSDNNFEGYLPAGGRLSLSFNSELRQRVPFVHRNFGVALFLDGGQVWQRRDELDLMEIQFGVGGGIRYQSPIGPVRFDVGYKINPTDEDLNRYNGQNFGGRFDRWGFHFSIGQAF